MKTKAYALLLAIITVATTALRTICLLTQYEPQVGYLRDNSLSKMAVLLLVAGAFCCLLSGFLFPKIALDEKVLTEPRRRKAWAILYTFAAACCFFGGIYFLTNRASNSITLYIATGVFSLVFAMFFLVNCSFDETKSAAVSTKLTPWLYVAGIVMLLLLLIFSYFDMTVTLNGPFTTPWIFATLFGCIFFLMEIRAKIGRGIPRLHLPLALVAFFLSVSIGASNLLFSLFGDAANGVSISEPARPILLLSVAFAAAARLLCFSRETEKTTQNDNPVEIH